MKKKILRKGLALGIIVLFVGASVVPNISGTIGNLNESNSRQSIVTLNKGIFYVGGSGPGNYTSIQDAIDNASNGDTVFVYDDSSPYYENVIVDKSINLLGENRNTTVINGSGVGDVVLIDADWVNISGFTIRNSYHDPWAGTGIVIRSDYNTITGNDISKNVYGIGLWFSSNNVISDNTITSDVWCGIVVWFSSSNTITGNDISKNVYGIGLWFSSNNITGNIISNNQHGIKLRQSNCNTITGNNIKLNKENGIWLEDACNNNTIYHNNFINNGENANDECDNIWDDGEYGNYWDEYKGVDILPPYGIGDWPYNIPGGDNKDRFPLMGPWPDPVSKTMPKNQQTSNTLLNNRFFFRFLDSHPNLFPILQKLLRQLVL